MASERGSFFRDKMDNFEVSGPRLSDLTPIDWRNEYHRRSVAACLVQGVYVMERERNHSRLEMEALAPPWWKSLQFELYEELIDTEDSSIFGAIFKLKRSSPPCYVIAFRGTQFKTSRDVRLDFDIFLSKLRSSTRFEIALEAVHSMVYAYGSSNIWLAGHSLGSALGMLVGKRLAKDGFLLESFLFNPPFTAAPIEQIKYSKVKHLIRFTASMAKAIIAQIAFATANNNNEFVTLSEWFPSLYVNPSDLICCEYIGYFEHRNIMEAMGFGMIEKLATKHSIGNLVMNAVRKESLIEEPLHLIPSANLIVNVSPAKNFLDAHGIDQWWRSDICIYFRSYRYLDQLRALVLVNQ